MFYNIRRKLSLKLNFALEVFITQFDNIIKQVFIKFKVSKNYTEKKDHSG